MARSLKHTRRAGAPRTRRAPRQAAAEGLGPWVLVRAVAEGAFSTVYQARAAGAHDPQSAPYAVKLLKPQWHDEPAAVKLLRREARVGRAVSHPHLVPILAAQVHESPYYVVMPWLEGSTLAALVAADSRPELPVALWIARQAAEALDALHGAGWLHADVKPGNIMVSPEGHATLVDLGFARRPDEAGAGADRALTGTIAYMAPERITSALCVDIRSDIFSLGVTLFELLTGRLPFAAGDLAALVQSHRQDEPRDLRSLVPHLPQSVALLVRHMLAKEPLRRPQTPRELVSRLAALEIESFGPAWE